MTALVKLGGAERGFFGQIGAIDATGCAGDLPPDELERRLLEMGFAEGARVEVRHFGYVLRATDNVITSIEVIERPLQVGDRVIRVGMGTRGTITAIDDAYALVLFDVTPNIRCAVAFSDLRRAS